MDSDDAKLKQNFSRFVNMGFMRFTMRKLGRDAEHRWALMRFVIFL